MYIVDTHAHLDDERYTDLEEVLKRAKEAYVKSTIIPGADMNTLSRARKISEDFAEVYFASGVHPYDINNFDIKTLKEYALHEKCVAIGECGLDYYYKPSDEEKLKQDKVFNEQIDLANDLNLPLIIHSRDANEATFNALKNNMPKACGVLHCFNASALLASLPDLFFGIGGVLTFKNAKALVEILPKLPLDRIILETDAPYLTPHPFRGKRNEPAYTKLVLEKMSELLNKGEEELAEITSSNAKKLFKKLNFV